MLLILELFSACERLEEPGPFLQENPYARGIPVGKEIPSRIIGETARHQQKHERHEGDTSRDADEEPSMF